jgi:hypothetical protein
MSRNRDLARRASISVLTDGDAEEPRGSSNRQAETLAIVADHLPEGGGHVERLVRHEDREGPMVAMACRLMTDVVLGWLGVTMPTDCFVASRECYGCCWVGRSGSPLRPGVRPASRMARSAT